MSAAIPSPYDPRVTAAEREILAMCSGSDWWPTFLRGYLAHAARRVAWNAILVDQYLRLGGSWLDLGSFGVEALWLSARRSDIKVRAVSYEGNQLALTQDGIVHGEPASPVIARVRIDQADIESEPLAYPDGSFDVVTCFECIEHLRSTPRPLLDQIRRLLRPDGLLLLTTPNVVGSRAMIRLLAGKHPQENPRYHRDPKYGIVHPKEYTQRELVALLQARGLAIVKSKSLYFRPRSPADLVATAIAALTRPLGGLALGLGAQPVVLGDNLFVIAKPHAGPLEDWPALLFENA